MIMAAKHEQYVYIRFHFSTYAQVTANSGYLQEHPYPRKEEKWPKNVRVIGENQTLWPIQLWASTENECVVRVESVRAEQTLKKHSKVFHPNL